MKDKIEKQLDVFRKSKNNIGLVYCNATIHEGDGSTRCVFDRHTPYRGSVYKQLSCDNFIGSCSFPLLKSEALEKVGGFDPKMVASQDWDTWLRISKIYDIDYTEDSLIHYYIHKGERITGNTMKRLDALHRLDTDCLEKLMSARSKIEGKIGYLASSIIGPDSEPMNVPAIDMRPAKNGYPHWYKYLSEGIVQISRATFVSILVSYDAIKKCGLPCKDYFIWGDDSEYTMRISKYYAPAYFVGASVALHKRFNAKKLDIMMENDTKRLEMFRKYYRNTTINEGLFVSQKQRKKLVIRSFSRFCSRYLK